MEDGSKYWDPVTHVGNVDGAACSWLRPCKNMAVVTFIWQDNLQMEEISWSKKYIHLKKKVSNLKKLGHTPYSTIII